MTTTKLLREMGFKNLVVGVKGNVLDEDVIEFENAGADFVSGKPMRMNVWFTVLEHVKKHGSTSRPDMALVMDQNSLV